MLGRFVQCDSGGRETGAAGNVQGAAGAARVPGAGCERSEGRGAAEGGGCGVKAGRGYVGGGGRRRCCCFLHQVSAGRSRQSGTDGWIHWVYPSNLLGKTKTTSNIKESCTLCCLSSENKTYITLKTSFNLILLIYLGHYSLFVMQYRYLLYRL